jgi:hypothetical protein
MNLCKKVREMPPVVSEWQPTTWCPDCEYYDQGACEDPARPGSNAPCPFDGKVLPLREVPADPRPEQRQELLTGTLCEEPGSQPQPAIGPKSLEQAIKDGIEKRTGGRIQVLAVAVLANGIVVRGRALCYYLKQRALQGVLDVIGSLVPTESS